MPRRTAAAAYRPLTFGLLIAALALLAACAQTAAPTASTATSTAATWAPKTPPLATQWTAQVTAESVLPEYPRPQMVRADWQNLNGVWEFAAAKAGDAPPIGQTLAERVLVPFPIESALSGIQRSDDRMWYRRSFEVPAGWSGRSVLLNFDAVDWETTVYVNGTAVGAHRGGYDGFSFDITSQLKAGANELIVGVFDPSDGGGQPVGKQRDKPDGIFYTSSSGIWQTVWLEPAPAAHITRLDMTPDVAGSALKITVQTAGTTRQSVQVTALGGTTEVGTAEGAAGAEITVPVPNARLWSPDDPFLYDLKVTLIEGEQPIDAVAGYFGMRSIAVAQLGKVLRPVLNGKFVFQMGTLDQGFWPDGLHTAPTDAALRSDIQAHKDLGFNMIRKHIKVEPQRWYYWADKIGLLVWQDMPAMRNEVPVSAADKTQFEAELKELIDEHRSSPAIITWVPFNEGWAAYDMRRIANEVKQSDPSRLVDNNSGVNCCGMVDGGNGDLLDWHVYVGPGAPFPSSVRASVLGEFGGLGLKIPGHEWKPGAHFSYQDEPDAAALTKHYAELIGELEPLMTRLGLSAAIYTQLTDVETELNGLYTYDRAQLKMDAATIKAANQKLIDASKALAP